MKKLIVFSVFACILAYIDLYWINISPYIAAGLAVGYLGEVRQDG